MFNIFRYALVSRARFEQEKQAHAVCKLALSATKSDRDRILAGRHEFDEELSRLREELRTTKVRYERLQNFAGEFLISLEGLTITFNDNRDSLSANDTEETV